MPTPVQLEVLARAEKRLTGHVARRGVDAEAIAICATYERMYAAAVTGTPTGDQADDITALVDALAPAQAPVVPAVVSPVLLANARAERARRAVVAR